MDSLHWNAVRGACLAACTGCVILPRPCLWFLTFFFLDCEVGYGTICLYNRLLQHLQWTEVFQLFPWRWFHLNFSPPVSFIWNTNAGRSSFCIRGWTCFCCFWFQHRFLIWEATGRLGLQHIAKFSLLSREKPVREICFQNVSRRAPYLISTTCFY